jgi:hypothetical protein
MLLSSPVRGDMMADLAIELTDVEVATLPVGAFTYETAKGRNFDGETVNTVLVTLTSTATVKVMCDFILRILKERRSGKIKINGAELSGVTEKTLLEFANMKRGATAEKR